MLVTSRPSFLLALLLLGGCGTTREKWLKGSIETDYSVHDPAFERSIGHVLGPGSVKGNRIVTLRNGDEIFPAMLQAIRSAKKTITFETFVFWDGDIAREFAEAFAERAEAGVKVHVIIDAHGGDKAGRANLSRMKRAGVEVEVYRRLLSPISFFRYNHRTHRKLLIVDGKVGFIGGVGIAKEWTGNAESPEHWRDTHYRIEGPAVAQLQEAFLENWMKTRHELLHGPEYFPQLPRAGSVDAQVFAGAPREGSINMSLMYELAIAAARKSIRIENAYFVPDRRLVDALLAATKRGVNVEIVIPGKHIDQKMVRHAGRAKIKKLAHAGVRIYEYGPTMLHCKLLIVDDYFVSVGSANFDNRSLRINDEANMNVFDRGFAARQARLFEQDKTQSELVADESLPSDVVKKPVEVPAAAASSQL